MTKHAMVERHKRQLPLGLKLADQAVFESFYAGPNEETVEHLKRQPEAYGGVIWLWGRPSSGKTHLLQSVCAANSSSAYLPLDDDLPPAVLDGFAQYQVVCLDGIDSIIGNKEWERQLFVHFNEAVLERKHTLVVTSKSAPKKHKFALDDLRSRLLSGPVFRLDNLDDEGLLAAVKLRAKRRGLELPAKTGRFLLTHFQRDMHSLCQLLDRLDTASLVHKSRLTVALVKATLDKA